MRAPLLDDDPGFLQAVEDFAIQQFIAQLAVEAFTIAIFPRTSWFDVEGPGPNVSKPVAQDFCSHLRSIVESQVFGNAAHQHDVSQSIDDAQAVDAPGQHGSPGIRA